MKYLFRFTFLNANKSERKMLEFHIDMKLGKAISIIIFFVNFSNCRFADYKSQKIISPSKRFYLVTNVNRTNKSADNYADVFLKLYDMSNILLDTINTHAGDFNKWAIGWNEANDTIILFSSDIGNKAWSIQNNKLVNIKVDDQINQQANQLKVEKYKN